MAAESHRVAEGLETDFSYTPNYGDLQDLQGIEEYTRDKLIEPGQYSRDTEVGFIGSKAFYVHEEENPATSVAGALMAEALMNELDVEGPDIFYDKDNGKILVEEVPGVPSNDYRATSFWKMAKHMLGKELEGNKEEVNQAIGLKYLLGDSDIPPNIVVTENSAAPIDFDKTGEQAFKPFLESKGYARAVYGHFNWDFDEQEFKKTVEDMVQNVEIEGLEGNLREQISEAPESERRKDYLVRNSLENFEQIR